MTTTINNKELPELNVRDLSVVLINQDVDICTMQVHADTLADLPADLAPLQSFDVRFGARRIFQGVVLNPELIGEPQAEGIVLRTESVVGRALRETMRETSMPVVQNNALTTQTLEFVRMEGKLNAIVSAAAAQVCTVGAVDLPDIEFPTEEQFNVSCLDVIRRAMSYAPGSMMWIDYSVDPPRFYAARHDSPLLTNMLAQDWVEHRIRHLLDQRVRQVRMRYIQPARLTSAYQSTSNWDRQTIDTHEYLGQDASSVVPDFTDNFHRTITLPGRVDVYRERAYWYSRSISDMFGPSGAEWVNVASMNDSTWWDVRQFIGRLVDRWINQSDRTGWIRVSLVDNTDTWLSGFYSVPDGMTPSSFRAAVYWNTHVTGTGTNKTFYESIMPSASLLYSLGEFPAGVPVLQRMVRMWRWFGDNHPSNYEATGTATFIIPQPGWQRGRQITRRVSADQLQIPSGVANSLKADFNRQIREGHVLFDRSDDVSTLLDPASNIIGVDGDTVRGIRRRSFNAMSETLRAEFGPPTHLSPAQVVRAKMFRSA